MIPDDKAAACAASRDNCVHRYQSNRYSDIETTMFHFKYMFANNVYSSYTLAIHPAEDISALLNWYCDLRSLTFHFCHEITTAVIDYLSINNELFQLPYLLDDQELGDEYEKEEIEFKVLSADIFQEQYFLDAVKTFCYFYNRIAHCEETLLEAGDRRRLELQQDYKRSREFNMVRMGVWIYKNITWLRNDFDRDFQDSSPPKYRPVYAVELCDLFSDREEDVPRDIVEMAVDYSDLLCTAVYEKTPSTRLVPERLLRPPSIHIVVASTGTRPQIYGLIASLQDLIETDYLTVIIDGQHENSTMGCLNLSELKKYVTSTLKCQFELIVHGDGPMGYWGHGVRMAYRHTVSMTGKGDFIWHLDDDNVVLAGAIAAMRVELVDASVLYLFRCEIRKNLNELSSKGVGRKVWTSEGVLKMRNVDTGSGLVPIAANRLGEWGMFYGGDYSFYESILPVVSMVRFVDIVSYIHHVKETEDLSTNFIM
eukprot:gene29948-39124_t